MPWGPGGLPESTALVGGLDRDDAHARRRVRSRSTRPQPVSVPPVPTPATNAAIVAARLLEDLERRSRSACASGFAGFSNCRLIHAPAVFVGDARARASTAPAMPSSAGVRTISAPYARRM